MLTLASLKPQSYSTTPRLQGTLWKWTNYLSGWQQRWFVLDAGNLAYYLAPDEVSQGCRGSLKVTSCDIHVHPSDHTRFDIVMPGGRYIYLKASSKVERQQWVVALGTTKQEEEGTIKKFLAPSLDQQVAVRSKMVELQLKCQQLFSQVTNMKKVASSTSSENENMVEMAAQITISCDSFLKILSECMLLSTASITGGGVGKLPTTPTDQSSPTSAIAPTRSLPGRPAVEVPHIPSQNQTTFRLPKQPPAASPSPSLSLPPLLPGPRPSPSKESAASSDALHSLPSHMMRTSSPKLPSTDAQDHEQESNSVTESSSLAVDQNQSQAPASRSHSRANSELFVTPTSTPTSSPPPSPSHSHRSPQDNAKSSSQKLQRIGDTQSATSSNVQSFFSKAPHKFEDLVLSEDEGIPTLDFLNACRAVVPFFDTLSSTAFAPVKADINGNIEKLSQKYLSSPEKFHTLQSLVLHELHTKTHEAKNSATDALLWLKRAMEFIQVFISEVAGGEHSLDIAAGKAYTKSLRKYHNWIVRGIFSVAVRAVPYHKDFLVLLGSDGTAEGNAAVTVHMADFSRSLEVINSILNQFYQTHKLDSTPYL